LALAIIGAHARKQSGFLLELADNGAGRVLTLSATVLAIIASVLANGSCSHWLPMRFGGASGGGWLFSKTNLFDDLRVWWDKTPPGSTTGFSKVFSIAVFRNIWC